MDTALLQAVKGRLAAIGEAGRTVPDPRLMTLGLGEREHALLLADVIGVEVRRREIAGFELVSVPTFRSIGSLSVPDATARPFTVTLPPSRSIVAIGVVPGAHIGYHRRTRHPHGGSRALADRRRDPVLAVPCRVCRRER